MNSQMEVKGNIPVRWKSLESTMFRKSPQYQEWKKLLHDFMTHSQRLNILNRSNSIFDIRLRYFYSHNGLL